MKRNFATANSLACRKSMRIVEDDFWRSAVLKTAGRREGAALSRQMKEASTQPLAHASDRLHDRLNEEGLGDVRLPRPRTFWRAAVSTNPNGGDTNVILSQLETSGPRGSCWVGFTALPNLRSFTRCGCLLLGKLDHFTASVAGYRLHICRKEISNVEFDHFRHKSSFSLAHHRVA